MKQAWIIALTVLMTAGSSLWGGAVVLSGNDIRVTYPDFVGDVYYDAYVESDSDYNVWSTDPAHVTMDDWIRHINSNVPNYLNIRSSTVGMDLDAVTGYTLEDTLPEVKMTVDGLDDTQDYDVYIVTWAVYNDVEHWGIYAGLESANKVFVDQPNADVLFRIGTSVQTYGIEKLLGRVSGVREVSVYLEDLPGGSDQNHEVRFDGIALVLADGPPPVLEFTSDGQPQAVTAEEHATVSFQAVFLSNPAPTTATWYHDGSKVDLDDPDITVTTFYDAPSGQHTSTLEIVNAGNADEGDYHCIIDNNIFSAIASQTASLIVKRLITHWTLNQADYDGVNYLDRVAGYIANPTGVPTFVDGVRESSGAVWITTDSGWANSEDLSLASLTDAVTLSFWVDWKGGVPAGTDDLVVENNQVELTVTDAINADGNWQHVCITSQNDDIRIFLNGRVVHNGTLEVNSVSNVTLQIGHFDGSHICNGDLDDIRVYNYALDETHIWTLFTDNPHCTRGYVRDMDMSGPDGLADCVIDFYDFSALAESWLSGMEMDDLNTFVNAWLSNGMEE